MSDQLTVQIQVMERQYEDLKKYFAADGKVTPEEESVLKEVRAKIDAVREKAQARAAKSGSDGDKKPGSDGDKEKGFETKAGYKDGKAHVTTEAKKDLSTKNGYKAGAVVGLHANVSCKIGDPAGDPKRYPVTITVSFGGSAKVSGSKTAGKASVGVELKGSVERTMVQTHNLSEAELGEYVKGLQAASKGNKVAGKQRELAVIAVGVSQSWDAARQLWETNGGTALTAKTGDSLKNKGDSIALSENRTGGGSVNAKAGNVGFKAGTTNSQEKSTTVKRNDKGGLDVDTKSTNKSERELSGSANVGVVGVEIGSKSTRETSFGYSITVDPKQDPDGKILAWLGRCNSQEEYKAFITANKGKITVTKQATGQKAADSNTVGVSIGNEKVVGAKASIGANKGVSEETVRDGQGNLIKKRVVGTAGAGGTASISVAGKSLSHSDSVQDEAVAEIDGKGKANVTFTRTKTDGDVVDKSGLGLSHDDLKIVGGIAVRSMGAWRGAVRRMQETDDWMAAGAAIAKAGGAAAVVAEELARFIGKDKFERMKTFQTWVQNGYKGRAIGRKFEFPESLKGLQSSYDAVTADSLIDELNKMAESNAAAAVDKCKGVVAAIDTIDPQVRKNEDFANNAIKMEMLDRLFNRRQMLEGAIGKWGGQGKLEVNLVPLRDRLFKQLSSFSVAQAKVNEELHDLLAGYPQFNTGDKAKAKGLIRQLSDIHSRWSLAYGSMKETMTKMGFPKWDEPPALLPGANWPVNKPHEPLIERYEKAAGLR